MKNIEIVFQTLKNAKTPLEGGEVAKISNLDKTVVDKALKSLTKEGKIHSPKRCYYEPK